MRNEEATSTEVEKRRKSVPQDGFQRSLKGGGLNRRKKRINRRFSWKNGVSRRGATSCEAREEDAGEKVTKREK